MTITLITGGNKGLGREAARRLVQAGHTVWIGARDPERGRAAAEELGCRYVPLDVTDDGSVDGAVAAIRAEEGRLDVLVNNAGILGARVAPADTTADHIREVYETNVFGIVRVTHAMLPLLRESDSPVIVNVSSGLGSETAVRDDDRVESKVQSVTYPSSKSAVVMVTTQYARALPELRINAVDPGYTATDFNGHSGYKSVEEGAEVLVQMASIGKDGPTGTFVDDKGPVPW